MHSLTSVNVEQCRELANSTDATPETKILAAAIVDIANHIRQKEKDLDRRIQAVGHKLAVSK